MKLFLVHKVSEQSLLLLSTNVKLVSFFWAECSQRKQ